jgi:hypothetical protein
LGTFTGLLARNRHLVVVPGICPIHDVLIQGIEEKVMDEPDVAREVDI